MGIQSVLGIFLALIGVVFIALGVLEPFIVVSSIESTITIPNIIKIEGLTEFQTAAIGSGLALVVIGGIMAGTEN